MLEVADGQAHFPSDFEGSILTQFKHKIIITNKVFVADESQINSTIHLSREKSMINVGKKNYKNSLCTSTCS